jgi:hypothetical protein
LHRPCTSAQSAEELLSGQVSKLEKQLLDRLAAGEHSAWSS